MWTCQCRFRILIYFFTNLSTDLYYPMPSEHIEPCFVLCRVNHVLSYDVRIHKTIILKKCTTIVFKNERLSFFVNPNPNPNPNSNSNPNPNQTMTSYITLTIILTLTNNIFCITIFLG